MLGGDGDESSGIIFSVVILILILAVIGALIYLYVYVFKHISALQKADLEIKSKIGSLVRDINFTNRQEYLTDVEQQNNINLLNKKVGLN